MRCAANTGRDVNVLICAARLSLLSFSLAVCSSACAPVRPRSHLAALAAGDRAYTAGRYLEAADDYDRAARETDRERDRYDAVYRSAAARRRGGDLPGALARYDRVAVVSPRFERGPRARFEAAMIRVESDDPTERNTGWNALTLLVREHPTTGPGRRAMAALLRREDEGDPSGAQGDALLSAWLEDRIVADAMRDTLMAEQARRLERHGHSTEAARAWEAMLRAVPYPQNAHWDDGHVALARLRRAAGDPRGAVEALDQMLSVREPSYSSGTYHAPLFDDGAMLRAEILRDDLHDLSGAARAFHFVYSDFRTSLLRDDALWQEGLVRETANDSQACAVWERLAREFPCHRFGRRAAPRAAACGRPVGPPPQSCDR